MPDRDFSFKEIIANTNDIVIVTEAAPLQEPGPRIIYVNEAFTKLTGYRPEEVLGKTPRLLQGPDTSAETRRAIGAALQREEAFRGEILNYGKYGQRYWLDIQIVPLKDEHNQVTYFAAIERDLTERCQAEIALREQQTRTRAIVAAMAEGVVVQNQDGLITSCNQAAEDILGLSREQMMRRTSIDPRWSAIHEDGSTFRGDEHPAMLTLRTGEAYKAVIMGIQKPGQTTNWISINTSPVFLSESETPEAVVATFHDVTAQRLADQMKTEFISTVSHELRTPLTSIKGALGLLNGGVAGDVPARGREMLDIALHNVDRLSLLINDLLDIEKIAAGNMALVMKRFSLVKLIEKVLYTNAPYANEHQVRFRFSPPSEDVTIEADEHRLLQVLTNFLSNAAKFSPANSDIEIQIESTNENLRVMVCDNGPGISVEYRARVFERFSQHDASNQRENGGTGLGLAISKALIELHGGDIGFYENTPTGTCFYFELPCISA